MELSYFQEFRGEVKTLKLTRKPTGLGLYKDADGNTWDVKAIIGKRVCARRTSLHPGYYSTTGDMSAGNGSHTWEPYDVEVISDG